MPMPGHGIIEKHREPDRSRNWEYLATGACVFFAFNIGVTIGWIAPTKTKLLEPESPVPFTDTDFTTMLVVGGYGQIIGPLMVLPMVNKLGRKGTFLMSGLPPIVSSLLIMIANDIWMIYLARVLAGFALGTCICLTPMYLSEIASAYRRGAIGSAMVVMMNIGILFSYAICPHLSIATFAGVLMTLTLAFMGIFWFMPESPYFLALRGRVADAEAVLQKLRGKTDVSDELNTIKESMSQLGEPRETKSNAGGIKALFSTSENRRAITIATLFIIPQNMGGYLSILMYSDKLLTVAGHFELHYSALVAIGIAQLASVIISGTVVDKLGRKPLILGAGAIAGLANLIIACYLFSKEYLKVDSNEYFVVFCIAIIVDIFAFNCGLISTHGIVVSEILTTEVRGLGMCICIIIEGICMIIANHLLGAVVSTWCLGYSIIFFGSTLIVWSFTIAIIMVTPETKGKTFAQIQQNLNKG